MSRAALVKFSEGLAARIAPGPGDVVLWIHGYTLDSSSWIPLWRLLPRWSHVGIDLPGHGVSLPFAVDEDLPALARRIGRLALERDVKHVVALSFGTLLALQLGIEFPTAFSSIVLASPALGGGPRDDDVARRYRELMELHRTLGFGPHLRERWMQSPPDVFKGAARRPELWRQLWRLVGRHPWWELGDDAYLRLNRHPQSAADLQRVRAAILLVVGEHELPVFKRCAEIIRRAAPRCRRVYLPDVGHLSLLEDPERAHTIVEEHLLASLAPAREAPATEDVTR